MTLKSRRGVRRQFLPRLKLSLEDIPENGTHSKNLIPAILSASGYTAMVTFRSGEDLLKFTRRITDPELMPDFIITDFCVPRHGSKKKAANHRKKIILAE